MTAMTKTVSIEEAQSQLSELVKLASRGEKVGLTDNERPAAELVALPTRSPRTTGPRRFGRFAGKIHISDDFDAPLPDEFWLGES